MNASINDTKDDSAKIPAKKTPKKRIRRDGEFLKSFCEENKVELVEEPDYKNINLSTILHVYCIILTCKKPFKKIFRSLIDKGVLCPDCMQNKKITDTEKTCLEKYGSKNPAGNAEIRKKIEETCLKNNGVRIPAQSSDVRKKMKETYLKNTGFEHPMQNPSAKAKQKETCFKNSGYENPMQNPENKEKCKNTYDKKYGGHPSSIQRFKDKKVVTTRKNYGVDHNSQSEEIKEQKKVSYMKRYGVDHPSKAEEVKLQKVVTCNKNNGVDYPYQNPEILHRALTNGFKFKDYKLPSGKVIKIQGFENLALDELLETYDEDDIVTGMNNVPIIKWKFPNETEIYKHFPDIYIKSINKIIEVKSTYTELIGGDELLMKQKSAQDEGFEYEIWVYRRSNRNYKDVY